MGLQSTHDGYDYSAFLYPAFIQEETGARQTILTLWTGSQDVATAAELDDRLDDLYPFRDHFRDFMVRNFNRQLHGSPIVPHSTYDGALPLDEPYVSKVVQPGYRFGPNRYTGTLPIRVAPLAMQTVASSSRRSCRIKFDATGVGGGREPHALVKVGGQWGGVAQLPVLELCRENGGDEDMEEAYLLFSNFSPQRDQGAYDIEGPGARRLAGTMITTYEEHWAYDDANGLTRSTPRAPDARVEHLRHRMEEEDEIATRLASSGRRAARGGPGRRRLPTTTTTTGISDGNGQTTFRVLSRRTSRDARAERRQPGHHPGPPSPSIARAGRVGQPPSIVCELRLYGRAKSSPCWRRTRGTRTPSAAATRSCTPTTDKGASRT
jgi:hypothetical protein